MLAARVGTAAQPDPRSCPHPQMHCLIASRYTARVELSSKVVDCADRLQRTLAHELCHVGAWLLDHVSKPPHGQVALDQP